jgi:hypothetical protein
VFLRIVPPVPHTSLQLPVRCSIVNRDRCQGPLSTARMWCMVMQRRVAALEQMDHGARCQRTCFTRPRNIYLGADTGHLTAYGVPELSITSSRCFYEVSASELADNPMKCRIVHQKILSGEPRVEKLTPPEALSITVCLVSVYQHPERTAPQTNSIKASPAVYCMRDYSSSS